MSWAFANDICDMNFLNSKDKLGSSFILLFALGYLNATFDIPIDRMIDRKNTSVFFMMLLSEKRTFEGRKVEVHITNSSIVPSSHSYCLLLRVHY